MSTPEILADLARAFPRTPIETETFRVYVRELEDLPPEALAAACRGLIRTSEWFPTIRAIREATVEWTLRLPSEVEALAQVDARIRWAREGRDGEAPAVHPSVRQAVERVGSFHTFRTAEKPGVVRTQFVRYYQEIRSRQIYDGQTGSLSLPSSSTLSIMPPHE